jgi:MoaA/NifB/PqqE/SkfB family radical SAM enzyme
MNFKMMNSIYSNVKTHPFLFKTLISTSQILNLRYLNVRIDTTNFCNLRCKMCNLALSKLKKEKMSSSLFEETAKKFFRNTRMLYLSCGAEPLVHPKFNEIISASNGYGIPFRSFSTNGMLVSEKIVKTCIDSLLSEVVFSIDGNSAQTMEDIRIGSNYETVVNNLEMMDEMITNSGKKFPQLRINYTLMKKNFNELQDFIEHFSKYKNVYLIDIRHMRVHEGMNMDEELLSEQNQNEYSDILSKMKKECHERNVFLQYPNLCYVPNHLKAEQFFCPIPYFSIYIDSSGLIRFCPYIEKANKLKDFLELPSTREIDTYLKINNPNCKICETID